MRTGIATRCVFAALLSLSAATALASASIPLLNSDFESPTWINNGSSGSPNWSYQSLPAGGMAPNYNSQDPRFGTPGWAKTAVIMGGYTNGYTVNGWSENGEGKYGAQNNSTTPAGAYYNYVNGNLPGPANGQQFFSVLSPQFSSNYAPAHSAGYGENWTNVWNGQGSSVNGYRYNYTPGTSQLPSMYNFWIDQQPNVISPLYHGDINYPPMIPAATTIAGHTYQAKIALGNPLWNITNGNTAFPVVELAFTTGAGTYPRDNNTWLMYDGYGTTVAQALANGSEDPNWQIAPGTFKDLSVTWTAPQSGLPLDVLVTFTGFTQNPGTSFPNQVSMDNVRLVDLSAVPEPTSLVFLVGGLLAVTLRRPRQQR
jgi:hypothetical protein